MKLIWKIIKRSIFFCFKVAIIFILIFTIVNGIISYFQLVETQKESLKVQKQTLIYLKTAVIDLKERMDLKEKINLLNKKPTYEYLKSAGRSDSFNLGNGQGYSVRDVVDVARKISRKEIKLTEADRRPGDPPKLISDCRKANRNLGWNPQYPVYRLWLNHYLQDLGSPPLYTTP